MARALDVLMNGELVGSLREENDLWAFDYAAAWRAAEHGFDLSPALPRAKPGIADGASSRPVQWYFDNLLPEEALRTILAKEAKLNADDAFGLLAYFGSESAGSLVLREPGHADDLARGLKLLSLAKLSRRITNLPQASMTKEAPKRMSLAGAQHKLMIVLRDGELFEPLPATPSTHILKPNHPSGDYPASAMNEYFIMRLARAVGLNVPDVHHLYVPQPVYVVDRFDRIVPAGGETENPDAVQRRHVIDTCQLLNKARTFKYSAAHLETLTQSIRLCRTRVAARLQLYRWIVFNLVAGNGDNHLKNISFLIGPGGIEIAPAYDLLCTAVYDTRAMADEKARWPHVPLAFSLGKADSFAGTTRTHVLDAGRALGLSAETSTRELDNLLKTILPEADKLIIAIEEEQAAKLACCPEPHMAQQYLAIEWRMLRAVRHIVLEEMTAQLSA